VLDQEPVDGGRGAERRDAVVLDVLQEVLGVEPVEVVDVDPRLEEPLAVQLAPYGLRPAGLGEREVQALGVHLVPVLRRVDVRDRVGEVVHHHLRLRRGAGGEVEEHRVLDRREVRRCGLPERRCLGDALVEPVPARPRAADQHLLQVGPGLRLGGFDLGGDVAVGGADDGGDPRLLEAEDQVVLLELVGGGDGDGADLVQAEDRVPELVVPLEDEQHPVALADAEGEEERRRLVAERRHLAERQRAPLARVVAPHEGAAVGRLGAQAVDHVVGEVEARWAGEGEGVRVAGLVEVLDEVLLVQTEHGTLLTASAMDHLRA